MAGPLQMPVGAPGLDAVRLARAALARQTLGDVRKVSPSDIQLVQNLIERCLQAYMPKLEVINTLQARANIEPRFTTLVWQQLERENPEFFWAYYLRLKLKDQIVLFNHLLEQQRQMVQKLQSGIVPVKVSRPGADFPGGPPVGAVQMGLKGQHVAMGAQPRQQPGGLLQVNGVCSSTSGIPGALTQSPARFASMPNSEPPQQGQVSNSFGDALMPSPAPVLPVPSALSGIELQELSSPLALSSPLDMDFDSNLLATCSSPDLGLPGTTADFMLLERGMPATGAGLDYGLQGMAPSYSYPDLASIDNQVPSYIDTEEGGLGVAHLGDLPRISSLSDMMPLDLEALDRS